MLIIIISFSFIFSANQETYKDMIVKAQRLSLQRDRQKALQILDLSLQSKKLEMAERAQIIKALNRIGEIFFKDQTQAMFARAKSQKTQNITLAKESLNEALEQEPLNFLLLLQRALILKESGADCEDQYKYLNSLPVTTYYHPQIRYLFLQSAVCAAEGIKLNAQYPYPNTLDGIFMDSMEHYLRGNIAAALNGISQAIKMDDSYVALYWLQQKIYKEQDKEDKEIKRKWRQACDQQQKKVNHDLMLNFCSDRYLGEIKDEMP